jgi:tRNA(fMet)-specific endonuclease VapC
VTANLRYLLDTNMITSLLRDPHGRVAQRINVVGEKSVCSSIIVASEMRYGARKRGSARLSHHVDLILSAMELLPFEAPADEFYARIRHDLERSGTPIGPNDMLIAAQAMCHNLVVVTANDREFSRIHDLEVENWLA